MNFVHVLVAPSQASLLDPLIIISYFVASRRGTNDKICICTEKLDFYVYFSANVTKLCNK